MGGGFSRHRCYLAVEHADSFAELVLCRGISCRINLSSVFDRPQQQNRRGGPGE